MWGFAAELWCQLTQESPCLVKPASADFPSKHNESGPSSAPNQLRIRAFLPPPWQPPTPAPSSSAVPGRADPSQCNVEIRVVSIANCAPPNTGNPSAGFGAAKSVSDHHVCGDTCSFFATNPCCCAFHRVSPSSQNPRSCASCSVVTTRN